METKKCMWCLEEYDNNTSSKYCSSKCEEKSNGLTTSKRKEKGNFFTNFADVVVSFFTN